MSFSRRSTRGRDQEKWQVLAAARSASNHAERAASQAREASATARTSAASAAELVAELRRIHPRVKSPARAWALSTFCLACLGVAVWIAGRVPEAFTEPPAGVGGPEAVGVAVAAPSAGSASNSTARSDRPVGIQAYYEVDGKETTYVIWFPNELRGQGYAVLFTGSAIIPAIEVLNQDTTPTVTTEQCRAPEEYGTSETTCQVVIGSVPSKADAGLANVCSVDPATQPGYIPVILHGTGHPSEAIGWAHRVISLPDFNLPYGGGTINQRGDFDPRGPYRLLQTVGCKLFKPTDEWRITESSEQPSTVTKEAVVWDNPVGQSGIAVISTKRDAEAEGDLYLALAGFLGALSIGFIPIAYDAWREWARGN